MGLELAEHPGSLETGLHPYPLTVVVAVAVAVMGCQTGHGLGENLETDSQCEL